MNTEHEQLIVSLKKQSPDPQSTSEARPTSLPLPKSLIGLFVGIILLLGAGWYIYGGVLYEALRAPPSLSIGGLASTTMLEKTGPIISLTEAQLLERVGKLMELPQDEPTIAVVAVLAPLQDQPFFRNARVGDVVLMYKRSLKAILYDPETNKIIEVAPITLSDI